MTTSGWTIEKPIPTLAVPDLEVAIAFYEKIGFTVDWQWPEGSPTHAGLLLGSCSIMLALCEPAERSDVYFIVDDVAACYAHMMEAKPWELAAAARGTTDREDCPPAQALEPPKTPKNDGYGLTDFSIIDPWGHHMAFGQPLET